MGLHFESLSWLERDSYHADLSLSSTTLQFFGATLTMSWAGRAVSIQAPENYLAHGNCFDVHALPEMHRAYSRNPPKTTPAPKTAPTKQNAAREPD
jgi:hypothetical protein